MIVGALAGGLVGTIVLTTGSRLAQQLGWSRMDIPLLLGTAFSADRARATAIGYAIHFANGLVFSFVYGLVFTAVGEAGALFGRSMSLLGSDDDDAFLALTHASGVRSHLWASHVAADRGPRLRVLSNDQVTPSLDRRAFNNCAVLTKQIGYNFSSQWIF